MMEWKTPAQCKKDKVPSCQATTAQVTCCLNKQYALNDNMVWLGKTTATSCPQNLNHIIKRKCLSLHIIYSYSFPPFIPWFVGTGVLSETYSYTSQTSKPYWQSLNFCRNGFSVNPSTAQNLLLSHKLKQITRIEVQFSQVYIFSHLLLSGKLDPFPWCQVTKQMSRDLDHISSTLYSSCLQVSSFLSHRIPNRNLWSFKTVICNNLNKYFPPSLML